MADLKLRAHIRKGANEGWKDDHFYPPNNHNPFKVVNGPSTDGLLEALKCGTEIRFQLELPFRNGTHRA